MPKTKLAVTLDAGLVEMDPFRDPAAVQAHRETTACEILEATDGRLDAFVEADLGTVTNRRWALRTQAYIAYRLSGRFQARHGVPSFRVLTVTTTGRRLANLLATTRRAGGRGLFWFTTFDLLIAQLPLAPIWSAAGAGRTAVTGSAVSSRSDALDSIPSGDERASLSGQRGGR